MVVAPYLYPKTGGVENYAYNISKGSRENYGWEVVVVISNHERQKYRVELINGLTIHRLSAWFTISNTPITPLWYCQIKNIIQQARPDLVNVHSPVVLISDIAALLVRRLPNYLANRMGNAGYQKVVSAFT